MQRMVYVIGYLANCLYMILICCSKSNYIRIDLLEKLMVAQLDKNFRVFYGTSSFISWFTRARYRTMS
jgi:hypothetical protein